MNGQQIPTDPAAFRQLATDERSIGARGLAATALDHAIRRPILAVLLFLGVGIAISLMLTMLILADLRHRTTLESAKSYGAMLTVFRDYYTSVVVANARKSNVPISTNYHEIEGAIPPPATLTIEIGSWMESLINPGGFRFISNYPFKNRTSGGPRDEFEVQALRELTRGKVQSFTTVEKSGENSPYILRLAQPITMGRGCVECHNTHPGSIKQDWKIGDIRGVQVVSLPLPSLLPSPSDILENDREFLITFAGLLVSLIAVSGLLLALMHRLRGAVDTVQDRNVKLVEAREAAEMAADTKSRIMANVSHELRTPMNAIVGFSQMMSKEAFGPMGNQRYREYASEVHASSQELMAIMENMILMAELDSAELEMRDRTIDTGQEIRRIVTMFAPEADRNDVALKIPEGQNWPFLSVDMKTLRHVMGNLVANAVRHAGPGATARMTVQVTDGGVELSVTDDGIGIAASEVQRRMLPFEGIADPRLANSSGLGLGLNVAQDLSALIGGELKIESDTGHGLRATLVLPLSRLVSISESVPEIGEEHRLSA